MRACGCLRGEEKIKSVVSRLRYLTRTRVCSLLAMDDGCALGIEIRGLEQNPDTKSPCAQLARAGKKLMQYLSEGRYVANVVDAKVHYCSRRAETNR